MINFKDLIVTALVVLGAISDVNWLDVPFWVYIILGVVYVAMRMVKFEIEVVSLKREVDSGISRPTKETQAKVDSGISRPT